MFRKKIIGPPGPTGTSYYAWLVRNGKDGVYKMTDRSLYGARPPFVKIFAKEEKLDGMSEDELNKRVGMTLIDNSTDCNCGAYETENDCDESGIGCIWRPLFESCHPPELIDGSEPICATTDAPTMAPTATLPFDDTESPTSAPTEKVTMAEDDPWYSSMFKSREHESSTSETNTTESMEMEDDDDAVLEPSAPTKGRKLEVDTQDPWYEKERIGRKLELDTQDPWYETERSADERLRVSDEQRNESFTLDYNIGTLPLKDLPEEGPRHHTYLQDKEKEVELRKSVRSHLREEKIFEYIESLSLEDMLKEERRLEAELTEQHKEKERRRAAITYLRGEKRHYKSEIMRLETQLKNMAS